MEMPVNLAHLHLLLNHFPTVGTVIGLGLLLLAYIRKNDHLKRASLEVFFIIALVALPAYLTGKSAQATITGREGVSEVLIAAHEDAAVTGLVFMEITGFLAWLALWQFRRFSRPRGWTMGAVLVFSVVTAAMMAQAANLGGEIRHDEIRVAGAAPPEDVPPVDAGWLSAASIGTFVNDNPWVWSASETVHFIGLCFLFGAATLVNLRMLGLLKTVPFPALHLLPLGILGFALNLVTGMLFFISTPDQYTQNPAFFWKMVLLVLAGGQVLYFTVLEEAWAEGPGDHTPAMAKVIAASGIFLWVGVIYFGRMLPFLGNAF